MNTEQEQTTDHHAGFTGTRFGMTEPQILRVSRMLANWRGWLHHGDCKGADAQAHDIARKIGLQVAIHPPTRNNLRAFCAGDVEHTPKDYLARDWDIVNASVVLIAAPGGFDEEPRSGTWATIRYARKVGKTIVIVFPDGSISLSDHILNISEPSLTHSRWTMAVEESGAYLREITP